MTEELEVPGIGTFRLEDLRGFFILDGELIEFDFTRNPYTDTWEKWQMVADR